MARTILLLTPAWPSACSPVEERSNWVSWVAMAFTMVASAVPAFTIFTTSLLDRGALFCAVRLAQRMRKSAPTKMVSFSSCITQHLWLQIFAAGKRLGPRPSRRQVLQTSLLELDWASVSSQGSRPGCIVCGAARPVDGGPTHQSANAVIARRFSPCLHS